jgi:hypothetical protein
MNQETDIMEVDISFEWARRVIESCLNPFHLDCARKILEQFASRYGECEKYHDLLSVLVAKEPMLMVG